MDSASRLYERLGQIPQDPADSESLEDVLVCAFGAFERYYLCWKTRGGEYKQDGHDLPEALQAWLYPADGSTRDFPTLQVVFGRGEEYFASDKDGKVEYKEPEVKKPETPVEAATKEDRPTMRRSRTISFLRPRSDTNAKPSAPALDTTSSDTMSNGRSSSVSQVSTRPTSTSFPKPILDPALDAFSPTMDTGSEPVSTRSSFMSQPTSRPQSLIFSRPASNSTSSSLSSVADASSKESLIDAPTSTPTRLVRRSTRPLSMSFNPGTFPKIIEGRKLSPESKRESGDHHCPCCRYNPVSKPAYADASVQTDPEQLRIDTTSSSSEYSYYNNRSSSLDADTPLTEEDLAPPAPNPVFMGRMLDYFGNPGYQLGDSLMSSYYYFQQPSYQFQDYQQEVVYGEDWKEAADEGGEPV